jgi:alpha-tubulin suppressor-like RCC1 family protein
MKKYEALFALLGVVLTFTACGCGSGGIATGTVLAWGANLDGQIGDGTQTFPGVLRPKAVAGMSDVSAISAGYVHSLAIKRSDGTVLAWGGNRGGQIGVGTNVDTFVPVKVPGLAGVISVAGGGLHSLAAKSDGTVWAWGTNDRGQLGNGTTTDASTPIQVTGLTDVISVAAAIHSLAIMSDGSVWAWGDNAWGELGNGTRTNSLIPVQVTGLSGVKAIAGGIGGVDGGHTLALKSDGTVWAWGLNDAGQLGNGTSSISSVPVQVLYLTNVSAIAAGNRFSLALKSDGTVWAWGNTMDHSFTTPVPVYGLSNVVSIAAGGGHGLALSSNGAVWGWGANSYGQLGNGTTDGSNTPVRVSGLSGVTAIAAGDAHSLALK